MPEVWTRSAAPLNIRDGELALPFPSEGHEERDIYWFDNGKWIRVRILSCQARITMLQSVYARRMVVREVNTQGENIEYGRYYKIRFPTKVAFVCENNE